MEIERRQALGGRIRKRKADSDGASDRLSKVSRKLSLLNLERNGSKVEIAPSLGLPSKPTSMPTKPPQAPVDDVMQMDNSSHKVYIYNLDDELSDSDSSDTDGKLSFLPDLEKRLRQSRIPASVLANSEGELAGRNLSNELVLYNVPSSLSVPEGQDSVRKAIIETRARARDKQRREQEKARTAPMDFTILKNGVAAQRPPFVRMDASNGPQGLGAGITGLSSGVPETDLLEDPDAMDLD